LKRAGARSASATKGAGGRSPGTAAKKLEKLGIRSQFDLLLHLPLRYEDETRLTPLAEAPAGEPVLLDAEPLRTEVAFRPRRQLVVHALCDGKPLALRFFNFYGSQVKQVERAIELKMRLRAFGEVRDGWFGAEMPHPRYRIVREGEPLATTLTPIYPTTAGLSQAALRAQVLNALAADPLEDTLPPALRQRYALPEFRDSLLALHKPPPGVDRRALTERATPAWTRMAYRARRARSSPPLAAGGPLLKQLLARLPFELTGAQQRALADVLRDIAAAHPMQRLLQGDVGSGKTIVAAIAALAAVDAGWQSALMAPTEILGEQHYRKFSEWLAPLGVTIVWLHGGLGAKERRAARAALASGEAKIAVGTHALFQQDIDFARLGLVIVDEQHRFGVQQRLSLRKKGETQESQSALAPHQLMMSATPIPRTLAMSYYADLDVSVIDELPPGRQPVRTRLVSTQRRGEMLERICAACADGEQAYWVCPVIEESKDDLQTAIDAHAELEHELPRLRVGLLHGRLPADEKAATMAAFVAGEIHVLVATTVIEVGVDVPNATLMVIEHAERFGLAQLHQLRGRVGRGSRESVCVLLYAGAKSEIARARLKVIYEHTDGFEIARQDLLLRGPGEVLGERQSGTPLLRYADLEADAELLARAREAAEELLANDPTVARAHVERWLASRRELSEA